MSRNKILEDMQSFSQHYTTQSYWLQTPAQEVDYVYLINNISFLIGYEKKHSIIERLSVANLNTASIKKTDILTYKTIQDIVSLRNHYINELYIAELESNKEKILAMRKEFLEEILGILLSYVPEMEELLRTDKQQANENFDKLNEQLKIFNQYLIAGLH